MKSTKCVLLVAGLSLAMSFAFFACSSDSSNDQGGNNNNSSEHDQSGNNTGSGNYCGGKEYNTDEFRCESGELIGKCRGMDYYVDYQNCNNGVIEDKNPTQPSTPSSSSISQQLPSSSSVSSQTPSSSSVPSQTPSSSSSPKCGNAEYNPATHICYEARAYKTVTIGNQTWMAENLNYKAPFCYEFDPLPPNCDMYGGLYTWAAAMDLPLSCNDILCPLSSRRGICPEGWHIPNNTEWKTLAANVGGIGTNNEMGAGWHLKSKSGWNNDGNGIDDYGFMALPGGRINIVFGFSDDAGKAGYWWSSDYYVGGLSSLEGGEAYGMVMSSYDNDASLSAMSKINPYSVRCIKD